MNEIRENWENPPIPSGYRHIQGVWNEGYVISRLTDGSEFVWVPAMSLKADGSTDGSNYDSPFGSRCGFRDKDAYPEPKRSVKAGLPEQLESVKKYGGFYLSRYSMSRSADGQLQSVAGAIPVTGINQRDAGLQAERYEKNDEVSSHLPYDAEIDSTLRWLMDKGQLSLQDVHINAALRNTRSRSGAVQLTGSSEKESKCGFYDILGNVDEWTQEAFDGAFIRGCGGVCTYPMSIRCYYVPYPCYYYAGFRVALRISD